MKNINTKKKYQLTQPQKRIWYTQLIYPESTMFIIGGTAYIQGSINVSVLKDTILKFISMNEAFHIRFAQENSGEVYQYFSKDKDKVDFIDFSTNENPRQSYIQWLNQHKKQLFELIDSPLYQITITKLSDDAYTMTVKFHHIIADGWSIHIYEKGIAALYNKLIGGSQEEILFGKYTDFIEAENKYLNSIKFIKNKTYWNKQYMNLTDNALYINNNKSGRRDSYILTNELSNQIRLYCNKHKISINAFFVTCYYLYEYTVYDKKEQVIGIPVLGRSNRSERNTFGMFVNTLAIRLGIQKNKNVSEVFKCVSNTINDAYKNQLYPFNYLINDLQLKQQGKETLYNVSINYYGTNLSAPLGNIPVDYVEFYNGEQEYDLQIIIREWKQNEHFELDFDYLLERYTTVEIKALYDALIHIISCILNNEVLFLDDIDVVGEREKHVLVEVFNNKHSEIAYNSVLDLFSQQTLLQPNKMAIAYEENSITYQELERYSNGLAQRLKMLLTHKEELVGLVVTHSIEALIGILGILKAGAAFVPIDPSTPEGRLNYIIDDANINIVVTNCMHLTMPQRVTTIKKFNESVSAFEYINLTPSNLAYVIYTSGSTGKPKGVMIEHRQLVNYVLWAKKVYHVAAADVFPLYSSFAFDLTITSIFVPLISGASIIAYEDNQDEYVFHRIMRENHCTIMKLTPAHLQLLEEAHMKESRITRFIVGGENLKVDIARKINRGYQGKLEIFNEYGPTEATVGCMIYKYNPEKDLYGTVPIGTSADNVQIYILDKKLKLCPIGVIGEMYISGEGLARGYLNNEHLTNEKFQINPYTGKRMYQTGDLAKFIREDCIVCVGRSDHQIKIRGHRVELGEIENYLAQYAPIEEVIVLTCEHCGQLKIIAYYTAKEEIDDKHLFKYLKNGMAEYMLPAQCIRIAQMPLTVNGKIDKKRLPEVNWANRNEQVIAKSIEEKKLYEVISQVLGIKDFSMLDNIYTLGADSIKAIQMSSKLRDLGYQISVGEILANPIPKDMILFMKACNNKEMKKQREDFIEQTPIIRWFFEQDFKESNYYLQSIILRLKEWKGKENLQELVKLLLQKHNVLSVNYDQALNQFKYNDNINEQELVEVVDIRNYAETLKEEYMINYCKEIRQKIQFNQGLLIRSCVFICSEKDIRWFICAHHLIVDGVSWQIMLADIDTYLNEKQLTQSYSSTYGAWTQKLKEYENLVLYNTWDGYQSKKILLDKKYSGVFVGLNHWDMTVEHIDQLKNEANNYLNTNTNELLTTALFLALHNYFNQTCTIYVESHGRNIKIQDIDITQTVGWFTSIYPVDINVLEEDITKSIINVKEYYRGCRHQEGFMFGEDAKRRLKEMKQGVCFNYLGEVKTAYENFDVNYEQYIYDSSQQNECTSLLEINCMMINGKLICDVKADAKYFIKDELIKFMEVFKSKIEEVILVCLGKTREWTPSDIDTVDITFEELNSLFD